MLRQLYIFVILIAAYVNFGFSQTVEEQNDKYSEAKKTLEKVWETDQGFARK